MNDDNQLLDLGQVLSRLNCKRRHLHYIVGKGFPEPIVLAGSSYWYARDIDCYIYLLSRGAFKSLPREPATKTRKRKSGSATPETSES